MPPALGSFGINPGTGRNIQAFDLNGDGSLWLPVSMLVNANGEIDGANPLAAALFDDSGNPLGQSAAGGGTPLHATLTDPSGTANAVTAPLHVRLSDGTNPIGIDEAGPLAVRLCQGGDPNSVTNPVFAAMVDDTGAHLGTAANPVIVNHDGLTSTYYTMGSAATSSKQVKASAGRLFGADIVYNSHGSTLYLILMDRATAPSAGDSIVAAATGVISVTAAGAGNPGVRPYVSSRVFVNGLYAFVSTSASTLTFAASDLARVAIDFR